MHRHYGTTRAVSPTGQARRFGRANVVTSTELAPSLREGKAADATRQTRRSDRTCPLLRQDKPTTPTGQARHSNRVSVTAQAGLAPSLRQSKPVVSSGQTSSRQHGKRRHSDGASAITPTGQTPPLQQNKPRLSGKTSLPFRQGKCRRASRISAVTLAGSASPLRHSKRRCAPPFAMANAFPLSPFPPRGGSPTENTAHPPSQWGGCARVSRSRDWAYCAGCSAALPASSAMGMRTAERYVPSGP